jgi:transposase
VRADDRGCAADLGQARTPAPARSTEHGSGLGKNRWVVEAPFALLHWFRRLRIRWEVRADIHQAFLILISVLGRRVVCASSTERR